MAHQIIFGGGFFWCMEAVFKAVPGVSVTSGYAGGHSSNPKYEDVCSGSTGHAEVVRISYDKGRVSLSQLLDLFFLSHDPTTGNRQGNDIGSQYRSIIIAGDDELREIKSYILKLEKKLGRKLTTELKRDGRFYPAEENHQDYYRKHPLHPYCMFVIRPKLKKAGKLQPILNV